MMSLTKLEELDQSKKYEFSEPVKKIHDGKDVEFWLHSKAYSDVMTFLFQLNLAMFPASSDQSIDISKLTENIDDFPTPVLRLSQLINDLTLIIDEAPPVSGPRRFGNVAFRKWYELVESRLSDLLAQHISETTFAFNTNNNSGANAADELKAYLLGSFGSPQRLDFGTGHELSFLAFLACLWKLNAFKDYPSIEKAIVLGALDPYFHLIRKIIITYNLEPAGSHGVWGLDDHFFLPYIFGSAQLSAAVTSPGTVPTEGSIKGAPKPNTVIQANVVNEWKEQNLYFGAIGFISDVKRGPFWEHSPMLYDISGVTAGWAKINKGMLKMYHAEVLAKFPVVQHFPFGGLLRWESDPSAMQAAAAPSLHTESQPRHASNTASSASSSSSSAGPVTGLPEAPTKAPRTIPPAVYAAAVAKAKELGRARGVLPWTEPATTTRTTTTTTTTPPPPTTAMAGVVRQTGPAMTLSGSLPVRPDPRSEVDLVASASTIRTEVPWLRQPEGGPAPGMPMTAAPWTRDKPNSEKDTGGGTGPISETNETL